jgi:hypothetical protein
MEDRLTRLKTPEDCELVASNVAAKDPVYARQLVRRAVVLHANKHNVTSPVEQDALEALYANERALAEDRGKKVSATRMTTMIKRRGIIAAVERIVTQKQETEGYETLTRLGMEDKRFEAVVLRHPDAFSADAVAQSKTRLGEPAGAGALEPSADTQAKG